MANQFTSVVSKAPRKHKYNLGFMSKLTCNMGDLIPIYVQDVLPNDTFKLSLNNLIRFAPLYAPMMSEVDVYFHFFFVPNRLIWSHWETFITGSKNGLKLSEDKIPQKPKYSFNSEYIANGVEPTAPSVVGAGRFNGHLTSGSLADYLGFQTYNNNELTDLNLSDQVYYDMDAMPFRAYNLIWSCFYRDENLTDDPWFDENGTNWYADDSGLISPSNGRSEPIEFTKLRKRAWKKDYFTSALPWAQKGDDVIIPGSVGELSVVPNNVVDYATLRTYSHGADFVSGTGTTLAPDASLGLKVGMDSTSRYGNLRAPIHIGESTTSQLGVVDINASNFRVSIQDVAKGLGISQSATEGTIRELRRAMAAQKFLEMRAVGGSRYQEQNLMFFGIKGSDARLQRPEFLGGCKNHVVISQLLQTSETTQSSALGTPAGNAVSAGGNFIFNKTFSEYGFIMGLMSIMPKASYMDGIPRMYLKDDVFDYYWPQFAKIGEQPIYNQELFFDITNGNNPDYPASQINTNTFGYTPRYAEYRFRNDTIHGDFKDSLKFWTLGRSFSKTPSLNESFIECNPSNRVFNVTDESVHKCWCELAFNVVALRPVESSVNLV